ncbi:hypothetical protein QTP86_023097, partial [Hemibagrus guttatus]
QKLKLCIPVVRTSRKWTSEAVGELQGCLDYTDWDVFISTTNSLDEYTDSVTTYSNFCEDTIIPSRTRDITDPLLEPLQFNNRANRSVDDAVNMALHFILQHLDYPGSYARTLRKSFVDFSSTFNAIVPALLRDKLFQLNHISSGSLPGCVLSPLLFSLYTNSCTSGHQSVKLLKFAADTTLIGLISDGDKSAYRSEMDRLVSWCSMNNLELNSLKTVGMIVYFRKDPATLRPCHPL